MKIAFCCQHDYYGGLNNCGGSRTIVLSCKALNKLGHKAFVVTKYDKLTWIKHKKPLRHIPSDTDVCIACSVSDIDPMLKTMPKKAKAYWFCRLIENHSMPKRRILKKAAKVNVLVNSTDLHNWFKAHKIDSQIVYQGADLNKWRDLNMHEPKSVGFLVSNKRRKNFDFAMEVIKRLGKKYKVYGYGVDLNHTIKNFTKKHFNYFARNAGYGDLIKIYNTVGIWVSTSTKEGLHNPLIEAALCGCAVVYPDAPLAGCSDHCIDGKTAWQYKALDVDSCVEAIEVADKSLNEAHKDLILSKIGSREQCMKRLVETIK